MNQRKITAEGLLRFERYLREEERSSGTIKKYIRDLDQLREWLDGRPLNKTEIHSWKEKLLQEGFQPVTINSKLAAVNRFLKMQGWEDLTVKTLKVQRKMFCEENRELTKQEYERVVTTAQGLGKERLALLMETICATGIRVSELKYITVEAVNAGRTEIRLKGKIRVILLPGKLCRKLLKYAKRWKISSGSVFVSRTGKLLSRKQIWAEMKMLCDRAGVEQTKVFPHNLRHLFARCFYKISHDLTKLADVLGHSNIETTRIYLISSGEEHVRTLDRLRLVT